MAAPPKTLAEFFGVEKLDFRLIPDEIIQQTAFVTVDVQRVFADPKLGASGTALTNNIAEKIAYILPAFREAGFPILHIYTSFEEGGPPKTGSAALHKISQAPGDMTFRKIKQSAFDHPSPRLDPFLKVQNIKNSIAVGFNTDECYRDFVIDGLIKSFNICVLSDMIANGSGCASVGQGNIQILKDNGALIAESRDITRHFSF